MSFALSLWIYPLRDCSAVLRTTPFDLHQALKDEPRNMNAALTFTKSSFEGTTESAFISMLALLNLHNADNICLHYADVNSIFCNLRKDDNVSQPDSLNVPEILDRMKKACGINTDSQLAEHLDVSNKTVSSWRTRNSLPIEAILQVSEETNTRIDYFLFGVDREPLSTSDFAQMFNFDDLRMRDFEIAGESIIVSVLGEFADEELAFMDETEISAHGKSLGASIIRTLALIRQERRALLDSGKMDEASFDEYARKAFRSDLSYFSKSVETRKAKKKGPQ